MNHDNFIPVLTERQNREWAKTVSEPVKAGYPFRQPDIRQAAGRFICQTVTSGICREP
ncbi:MAG: hypothetical protein K2N34_00695 [Lachnospiraceae bacterium]|nr:hypothetical protein [Lachnospiraceae bacterium]